MDKGMVAKQEWLMGTDEPNGVRPVWCAHLRRANLLPQVEEFACGCDSFCRLRCG